MQYTGLSQDVVKRLHNSPSGALPKTINALVTQESNSFESNAIECIHDYLMLEPLDTVLRVKLSNNHMFSGWKNSFMDVILLEINRRLRDLREQMEDIRNLPLEITNGEGSNDNG